MGLVGDTQKEIFFGGFQRERERERRAHGGRKTVWVCPMCGFKACVWLRATTCRRAVLEGFYWRRAACARKSCASSKGAVVVRCRKVGTGEWKCRQPVTKPGPPALALSRSNLISSHPPHHILSRHCHFLGRLVMLSLSVPWETAEDKTVKKVRCGSCAGCLGEDCGTCSTCLDKPKFGGAGK